ncbi:MULTISPECIES: DUF4013 domain-containing protein [Haloferax]|uniref:DUF4013 domain-containing protein n=1 Tax=Haloferax marinum TaxID=2666143 RepID=A0A6A8G3L3_9EURY|nr:MULTISPECIES: DUF4013 domain-containing protein [Haloferax]KAB1196016.1 DUF4013 domain-containing protein [Haloferax sp. CBA1150]MRW94993.1 DUF4013 domain-containing protein [Haloferax marinum]
MLSDALQFVKRSDDWVATTIIGGVLALLFFLIVPLFILQGYFVRAMRAAAEGERAAPSFTDWGGLVVDGVKLFAVTLAWSLVAIIPTTIFAVLLAVGTFSIAETTTQAGTVPAPQPDPGLNIGLVLLTVVGALLVFALSLLVAYFVPAAGANFALEGRLGAGFDFRTIFKGAFTSEYAIAWVLAIVVSAVLGTIGSFLSFVLVGVFILFYVQVTTYYLWARGYADGLAKQSAL